MEAGRPARPGGRNARPPSKSMRLSHGVFQIIGCFGNACRSILDDLRDLGNLAVGLFPFLLVHVFPDRRNRLCPVTGVCPRRVNLVFEPGTLRQARFTQKKTGYFEDVRIYQLLRWLGKCRRSFGAPVRNSLCIPVRAFLKQINRIFHGRKIHVGRHDSRPEVAPTVCGDLRSP